MIHESRQPTTFTQGWGWGSQTMRVDKVYSEVGQVRSLHRGLRVALVLQQQP